jgi:hypothetical protein
MARVAWSGRLLAPSATSAGHGWPGTLGHDLRDVVITEPEVLADERTGNRPSRRLAAKPRLRAVAGRSACRNTATAGAAIPSLFAELLVPSEAVWRRRAVQQMVTQPPQDRYGEAGRGAQERGG